MSRVVVLGVFNADVAFRADRMPKMGETIHGKSFHLGPGGKGSNQAVAAARAGADTHMITRLGKDAFADMALEIWRDAGVTPVITQHADKSTGSAFIFIEEHSGNNAIIIAPGAAASMTNADIDERAKLISEADVFVTQFEQPMGPAHHALEIAHKGRAITVLNPAPAMEIPDGMLKLCDYVTPNESEAEALTGIKVVSLDDAQQAAMALVARGAGAAILTLGEKGALFHNGSETVHVPVMNAGGVADTSGAGDAFNGGLAAALARGQAPEEALRFAAATAAISVTRHGTAPSMPSEQEIRALLVRG
ncbi:MAG: ribokinase [Hoeflea sp.]|nr:ribokinase [Hoeflea sp.]|tara:strand:+ start:43771 stop:44691 length:921 start_codon:yes stop_codon:yes gene_type:complete